MVSAPFPYFGGKGPIVDVLNARFGAVDMRIDAFCGSAAWILQTPRDPNVVEVINDASADLVNVWRAIRADPERVASYMDDPLSTVDLAARKRWLSRTRAERLNRAMDDPDWYDAKAAGWWVWFVSGAMGGVSRIADNNRPTPEFSMRGIFAQSRRDRVATLRAIADRLRDVIITCTDWYNAVRSNERNLTVAILLDPPYPRSMRNMEYQIDHDDDVWHKAARWAIEHGDDPRRRIAVCGYTTPEIDAMFPASWERYTWTRNGGYANRGKTKYKAYRSVETVWFSPHCNRQMQLI